MRIVESVHELQQVAAGWKRDGKVAALVPTMGALHPGHMSLVKAARRPDARVIVSIFVNPLQFGPSEDLENYPRPFDDDRRLLDEAEVEVLFLPSVEEMYPPGSATRVLPGPAAEPLEGRHRPGHFIGVATVVARLLNASLADRAYFGRKDAQQVAVVRAMVRDLAIPTEIIDCATVRDADGLALSSRNIHLDASERRAALALPLCLGDVQSRFTAGLTEARALEAAMHAVIGAQPGVELDYATIVDPGTFQTVDVAEAESLAVVAARVGRTRLIDNAAVGTGDLLRYQSRQPQDEAQTAAPVAAGLLSGA